MKGPKLLNEKVDMAKSIKSASSANVCVVVGGFASDGPVETG